jgi:REP element-mobilizing transposase RayT
MNDHVHVLTTPIPPLEVERLVQNWKTYTTREIHRMGRAGSVWQREYFDRIIRSERDYLEKMAYIVNNPWKRWPGLEAYPWVWTEAMEERAAGGSGGADP